MMRRAWDVALAVRTGAEAALRAAEAKIEKLETEIARLKRENEGRARFASKMGALLSRTTQERDFAVFDRDNAIRHGRRKAAERDEAIAALAACRAASPAAGPTGSGKP